MAGKSLQRLFQKMRRHFRSSSAPTRREEARYVFHPVGFHGDRYLLQVVEGLLATVSTFIETGANVGSTLAHVASRHPRLRCLSCEPDPEGFRRAEQNTAAYPNATVMPLPSAAFFERLAAEGAALFSRRALFWLDAHGHGFEWPLREEVAFVTRHFRSAYLLIDDFRVPGRPEFGFDAYGDQVCDFEHVREAIRPGLAYRLYYPNYTERTSAHHELRGWGLVAYGEPETSPLERMPESWLTRAET